MSKNIIIKKDGEAQTLNGVEKITTNEVDGGMCTWLPEDELGAVEIDSNGSYDAEDYGLVGFAHVTVNVPEHQAVLGDLHVDKNGTYNASSDGYDAYDSVYVNVTSVTGTMPDGNEYMLELEPDPDNPPDPDVPGSGGWIMPQDENGNVVVKKIPSKIKIDTIPSKTEYRTGETVYLTGGVIHAYDKNDALFTNTDYPDGVIPNAELEVAPLTVSYQAAVDAGGEIIDPCYQKVPVSSSAVYIVPNQTFWRIGSNDDVRAVFLTTASGTDFTVNNTTMFLFCDRNPGESVLVGFRNSGIGTPLRSAYLDDDSTYYYNFANLGPTGKNIIDDFYDTYPEMFVKTTNRMNVALAFNCTFGSKSTGGVKQTEEVTWICPYTDKPMKDSYEIIILKPENSSDDEFSESSGGQHF